MPNPRTKVMPLRILLNAEYPSMNETIFNSVGEPLYILKEPHYSPLKRTVEFADTFFEQLIGISDVIQAQKFIQENPEYNICCPNSRTEQICKKMGANEVATLKQLSQMMVNEISYFHSVWTVYSALLKSKQNRTDEQFALEAFTLFINNFNVFETGTCENDLERYSPYSISLNDEPTVTVTISISVDSEVVSTAPYTLPLSLCINYIQDLLSKETANTSIQQSFDDFAFEYHCPTLLSAMYEKMLIAEFNKDTYRKCDVCSNYFKVDKSHPQTRCDIHMHSRRKKRQNAKAKERAIIELENKALEESMKH